MQQRTVYRGTRKNHKKRRRTGLIAGLSVLFVLLIFFAVVALVNAAAAPKAAPAPSATPAATEETPAQPAPHPYERAIANALLNGQPLADYERLNERLLMRLLVEEMDEPFDTVALGSSRILQMGADQADGGNFFNLGMSGADHRDVMSNFYLLDKADKLPQTLILGLDAWLLNPNASGHRANDAVYQEFLATCLGYETNWQPAEPAPLPAGSAGEPDSGDLSSSEAEDEPDTGGFWSLFSLPRFWQNITGTAGSASDTPASAPADSSSSAASSSQAPLFTDPLPVVEGDPSEQPKEVKMPDGTVLYPATFRNVDAELAEQKAHAEAISFSWLSDYTALDPSLCELFDRFVGYVRSRGVDVIFLLVPFHPTFYDYASEYSAQYNGLFLAEDYFTEYALARGIPIYGSYNPHVAQATGEQFYDGLHIKSNYISRFFPGVAATRQAQAAGQPTCSPWLQAGPRIQGTFAEYLVATRYEIPETETIRLGADVVLGDALFYTVERRNAAGALLARYAVCRRTGAIQRYDTLQNIWVNDTRFT